MVTRADRLNDRLFRSTAHELRSTSFVTARVVAQLETLLLILRLADRCETVTNAVCFALLPRCL
jgi:hypothetical protein